MIQLVLIALQEAASNTIDLEDDDPAIIRRMVNYMYQLDYTYEPKAEHETSHMMIDVQMYAIADKYDIPGLKRLAILKFRGLTNASWKTPAFPEAIKAIYETTPDSDRGLRDVVLKKSVEHSKTLFKAETGFKEMLQEAPSFASDLAKELSEGRIPDAKITKCIYCGNLCTVKASLKSGCCPYCTRDGALRDHKLD